MGHIHHSSGHSDFSAGPKLKTTSTMIVHNSVEIHSVLSIRAGGLYSVVDIRSTSSMYHTHHPKMNILTSPRDLGLIHRISDSKIRSLFLRCWPKLRSKISRLCPLRVSYRLYAFGVLRRYLRRIQPQYTESSNHKKPSSPLPPPKKKEKNTISSQCCST